MSHIHVSCRVRPQNSVERKNGGQECVKISDGKAMEISTDEAFANEYLKCTFDQVFGTNATQQEVYESTAKSLVLDLLEGYNCTVFAYGQTGSGKTHTIYGPKDGVATKPDDEGLIRRLVHDLYDHIHLRQSEQVIFEITCSFFEIYMEQVNDLLYPASKNLRVRENTDKGIYVDDLHVARASTKEAMLKLVERGNTNRVVACTRMNNDSSRSHTVLMMNMVQRDLATASEKRATMYVVDLAGSEMVVKTLATGKTLNEAKAINKSLSALSNVIKALADGKKHIPFRDSKLTRILQDSLGGRAKTCLIVTASSSSYNVTETISTVRFGMRAKEIKNDPTQHEVKNPCMCEYQQLYQNLVMKHTEMQKQMQALIQTAQTDEAGTPRPSDPVAWPSPGENKYATAGLNPLSPRVVASSRDSETQTSSSPQLVPPPPPPSSGPPSTLARTLTSLLFADQTVKQGPPSLGHAELLSQLRQAQENLHMCQFENEAMREMNQILSAQNAAFNTRITELESSLGMHESALDALKEINRTISAQNTVLNERNQELEMLVENSTSPKLPPSSPSSTASLSLSPEGYRHASFGNTPPDIGDETTSTTTDPATLVEILTKKVVEMKMHVHYVTEYTKSILEHEPYQMVRQLTQLRLENERLRLEEHHHANTIKELQTKCQAMSEAVSKTDDNTSNLQRTIAEYQALYKEQVRLSQERQQNLLKEVEYYKMIWQRVPPPSTKRDNNTKPTIITNLPSHIATSDTTRDSHGSTAHSLFKAASFSGAVPTEPLSLMSLKRSATRNRTIVKPQSPKMGWQMPQSPPHTKATVDEDDDEEVHTIPEENDPLSTVFDQDALG
ncbi:hypothetical protein H310_00066 [Aphanomyces invadans]|uniref:Kinesin-like protein n=1 Tax=Aphanomyces invadans TaxID=157072 RepID=A0A024UV40_9STRA|nr:hypothetical protein H310_00066 [Aphanomyces invadans]ETW09498.1 hypothetical protein H310_00066 [Aphanomyces invadans]|eukprot:XP_008860909.1 hypothetical protein H310_00066 [Aphanomyces invadans]